MVNAGAMNILLVTAELSPWVRSTEAAETVAALAKTFRQLGNEVTVIAPHAPGYEAAGQLVARRLTPLTLDGDRDLAVFDSQLGSGARLVLLGLPVAVNGSSANGGGITSEVLEAAWLFAQGVAALVGERAAEGRGFDVVHCQDFSAGLVPLVLERFGESRPRVVMSVSDARLAGLVEGSTNGDGIGSDPRLFEGSSRSLLKPGILAADAVILPSETYAAAVKDPGIGGPLAACFGEIEPKIFGIFGGIDYARVNPATDPSLVSRYDAEDASAKSSSKAALLVERNWSLDGRPLLLVPGPLTLAAGADLVAAALSRLLPSPLCVLALSQGSDEPAVRAAFAAIAEQHPDQLALVDGSNPEILHRGFAAADLVLIASRYEPGGWRQLFAQRYGAAPIAHAVGGLVDSIVDADTKLQTGTGFLFDEASPEAVLAAIQRAVAGYVLPEWEAFRRRMMRLDLNWDRPARRLLQVYRQGGEPGPAA